MIQALCQRQSDKYMQPKWLHFYFTMKISELILSKAPADKMLPKHKARIDFLKKRIHRCADVLMSPETPRSKHEGLTATLVADMKELRSLEEDYGRPITEAVNKLPLTESDFDRLKEIFLKPIPVVVAQIYIQDLIDDDSLTAELQSLEITDPSHDARELIANWIKQVMPDQLYRFTGGKAPMPGEFSPIHGYDTGVCKSSGSTLTGNAFGRF